MRRVLRFIMVGVGMLVLVALTARMAAHHFSKVCYINCGDGRSVLVTKDLFWEMSQPVYYEVRQQDMVIVPRTCFHDTLPSKPIRYQLVTALGGDVVGLRRPEITTEFEMIHQFSTGFSWPWNEAPLEPHAGDTAAFATRRIRETRKLLGSILNESTEVDLLP